MKSKTTGLTVLILVLLWGLAAAAEVASLYLGEAEGAATDWAQVWYKRLFAVPYWVGVSVLALSYFGSHPPARVQLTRHVLVTLLAISAVSLGFAGYISLWIASQGQESWSALVFGAGWAPAVLYGVPKSGVIALAAIAYTNHQRVSLRERQHDELQLRLTQTELLLFRSQLEPHFLFNTLNSVAALIRLTSYEAAIEAIHQLSKLLRHVLDVGTRQLMPFSWEADFTRLYVELQGLRFRDKLQVHFTAENIPGGIAVPILLLQPLIENAINHGPLADAKPCEVFVAVSYRNQWLHVEVRNVIGLNMGQRQGGVGLKNIQGRLQALYGADCEFQLEREGDQFVVKLGFPAMTAASEPVAA